MSSNQYSPNNLPLGVMMLTGGLAGSIAEVIIHLLKILTIPFDTAKVRLQIQG